MVIVETKEEWNDFLDKFKSTSSLIVPVQCDDNKCGWWELNAILAPIVGFDSPPKNCAELKNKTGPRNTFNAFNTEGCARMCSDKMHSYYRDFWECDKDYKKFKYKKHLKEHDGSMK